MANVVAACVSVYAAHPNCDEGYARLRSIISPSQLATIYLDEGYFEGRLANYDEADHGEVPRRVEPTTASCGQCWRRCRSGG